jgi:hypothetical protein
MDPTECLREILELAHEILQNDDDPVETFTGHEPVRLAELVEALNDWILKGGFLPESWQDKRHVLQQLTKASTIMSEAQRPAGPRTGQDEGAP